METAGMQAGENVPMIPAEYSAGSRGQVLLSFFSTLLTFLSKATLYASSKSYKLKLNI